MENKQLGKIESLMKRGRRGYCMHKGESRTKIPDLVMEAIINRDKDCVYCRRNFGDTRCNQATWEHINGNTKDVEKWNIALCCGSCNSSRSDDKLTDWFKKETDYRKNNVNPEKVSEIVKDYIKKYEK